MQPFKHQSETTNFIVDKKQCLITSDPGTGKTRSVIDAYAKLPLDKGKVLVIAPLSILHRGNVTQHRIERHLERSGFLEV